MIFLLIKSAIYCFILLTLKWTEWIDFNYTYLIIKLTFICNIITIISNKFNNYLFNILMPFW